MAEKTLAYFHNVAKFYVFRAKPSEVLIVDHETFSSNYLKKALMTLMKFANPNFLKDSSFKFNISLKLNIFFALTLMYLYF